MNRVGLLFILLGFWVHHAQAADGVVVENAWVRPTFGKVTTTAAYMTVSDVSGKGDTLLGIQLQGPGAAQMHDTTVDGAVMRMRARDTVAIPPRGSVTMKPGELHIMITGLTRSLVAGETLPMVLHFAKQGDVAVSFSVRAQ